MRIECDGEIVVNRSLCFKAEDIVEVDVIGRAMDIMKSFCVGEALVVIVEVVVVEITIGGFDGADAFTTQSFDETILVSTVGAFDSSFCLW